MDVPSATPRRHPLADCTPGELRLLLNFARERSYISTSSMDTLTSASDDPQSPDIDVKPLRDAGGAMSPVAPPTHAAPTSGIVQLPKKSSRSCARSVRRGPSPIVLPGGFLMCAVSGCKHIVKSSSKWYLQGSHYNTHVQNRPYLCGGVCGKAECEMAFADPNNCRRHQKKKFPCHKCAKKFDRKSRLNSHLQSLRGCCTVKVSKRRALRPRSIFKREPRLVSVDTDITSSPTPDRKVRCESEEPLHIWDEPIDVKPDISKLQARKEPLLLPKDLSLDDLGMSEAQCRELIEATSEANWLQLIKSVEEMMEGGMITHVALETAMFFSPDDSA